MPTKPFVSPNQFAAQSAIKQKANDAKSMARYESGVKANGGRAPGSVASVKDMNQARAKVGAAGVGFGGEPSAKKVPQKTVSNTLRSQKAKPNKPTKNVMVAQGTSPSKAAKSNPKTGRY